MALDLIPSGFGTEFASIALCKKRVIQYAIDWPSCFCKSIPKCSYRNTNFSTPFRKSLSFSFVGKFQVIGSIIHLSQAVSPSNISFFIMPVVVNSIKTHAGRALAKMREKFFEIQKFISDASCPVIFVRFAIRIVATLPHAFPCGIFSAFTHSVSFRWHVRIVE